MGRWNDIPEVFYGKEGRSGISTAEKKLSSECGKKFASKGEINQACLFWISVFRFWQICRTVIMPMIQSLDVCVFVSIVSKILRLSKRYVT